MADLRFYPAKYVMRSVDPSTFRITDIWTFRSTKSNKRYIIEVEHFKNNILGIKFFWKGVSESHHRYSLMTNDYEPRTIVMSCIHVMLKYFHKNSTTSFGFVAADNIEHIMDGHYDNNFVNKRFRFYRRMMLSLFSPEKFLHYSDFANSIYLLINREAKDSGLISVETIQIGINLLFEGSYNFTFESS